MSAGDAVSRVIDTVLDDAVSRAVEDAVAAPECGAVVTFRGVGRDADDDRGVTRLDSEAHPDATAALRRCVDAVAASTGLRVAAASAGHRREAFEACSLLVERIKAEVPIWKRQHFADGVSEWVGL